MMDDGNDKKDQQFNYFLYPLPHTSSKEENNFERNGRSYDNFVADTACVHHAIHLNFSKNLDTKPLGRMELIASIVASCVDRSRDCDMNDSNGIINKEKGTGKRKPSHICKTCEFLCKTGAQYLSKKMLTFHLRENVSTSEEECIRPQHSQDEERSKNDSNNIITPSKNKYSIMMNTLNGKVDTLLRVSHPFSAVNQIVPPNSLRLKNKNGSTITPLDSGSLIAIIIPAGAKAFTATGISHHEACFRFMQVPKTSNNQQSHQISGIKGSPPRIRLLRDKRRKRTRFEMSSDKHGPNNTNIPQTQMATPQETNNECTKQEDMSSVVRDESVEEESPLLSLQHYSQRLTCNDSSQNSSHEDPLSLYASLSPEQADNFKEKGYTRRGDAVNHKTTEQHERSHVLSKLNAQELVRLRDEAMSAAQLSVHCNAPISKRGLKAALLSMAALSRLGNQDLDLNETTHTNDRTFPSLLKSTRIKVKGTDMI